MGFHTVTSNLQTQFKETKPICQGVLLGVLLGVGSMVPERRGEIVSLGMRSIISGTLATCMAGAIVGIIT